VWGYITVTLIIVVSPGLALGRRGMRRHGTSRWSLCRGRGAVNAAA
jgi:hypothetical protein